MKNNKYKLLRQGILFDLIGMCSMLIPVIGPFLDLIWAPLAAKKMHSMYSGTSGKVASIIVFIEELVPMTDFIPTFTIMWVYTFVVSSQKSTHIQTIDVSAGN